MKKLNNKTLLLGAIVITLFTISASAQPWQKGGNAISVNPPTIGTLGAEPLRFITSGTEKMRILTGGFLGIGTTTPVFRVDVSDNLTNTFLRVRNTGTTGGGIIFQGGGAGAKQVFAHATGPGNGQGTGKFVIRTDSIDHFSIDVRTGSTFGFHGLSSFAGFTNPQSLLHLHQSGSNAPYAQWTNGITGNATANDGFRIGIDGTGNAEIRQQESLPMTFWTRDPITNIVTERMRILSNGNVGIGIGNTFPLGSSIKLYVLNTEPVPLKQGIQVLLQGNGSTLNFGGTFIATMASDQNTGISAEGSGGSVNNVGGDFTANGLSAPGTNYGIRAGAVGTGVCFGIQAFTSSGPLNYAGWFIGNIKVNSTIYSSDSILKENISNIPNALSTIRQLQPHKFNFKTSAFPYLNLPSGNQFGMVAQEVESTLPELVKIVVQPERKDTAGNVVSPQLTYKGLDYTGLIPISIEAIKQLDSTVTKATSVPDAPVLISPADGTVGLPVNTKAQLTWHSVSQGIILYHAQIAKDNVFSNLVFDVRGITDTTSFFGVCDTVSTTYYWRVSAKNNTGTGAWSQVFSFTDTVVCRRDGGVGVPRGTEFQVAFASASDANYKTNVTPMTDALSKVNALTPITYNWDSAKCKNMIVDNKNQIGLIAQDVEQIVPEVVYTDSNGMKYIDYGRLSVILLAGMKEQQAQITALQGGGTRTNGNSGSINSEIDVNLASKKIVLDQNSPNPFKEQTTIPYFIPKDANDVKIIFTDMDGDIIKEVRIAEKGKGQLNVYASNLSSGIYTYSIVADGVTLDTKKMVRSK